MGHKLWFLNENLSMDCNFSYKLSANYFSLLNLWSHFLLLRIAIHFLMIFSSKIFFYFEESLIRNQYFKDRLMDHAACIESESGYFWGGSIHFRFDPLIDCNTLVQAKTGLISWNIQWLNSGFTVVRVHDGALGQIPHLLRLPRRIERACHVRFLSRELKFEHIKGVALNIEYNIFSSFRKIQFK